MSTRSSRMMSSADLRKLDAALERLELHVADLRLSVSASGTYGAGVTLSSKSSTAPVGATR